MLHHLLAALLVSLAPAPADDPTLAQVVREHFDAWDTNHDNELSPAEIDARTTDPSIRAEAAAAVATLKLAMRRKTDPMKALAKSDLEQALPETPAPRGGGEAGPADNEPPRTAADLQRRYRASLRRIRTIQAQVFTDDQPDLASFHQGPLGDCYFVSMVGALAFHHPRALRDMVRTADDGSLAVVFPGHDPVPVPALTDAQVAISSTSGKDGRWLPVIEHAFGALRQRSRPDAPDSEPTDLIARGGSAGQSIELLTNHDASRIMLGGNPAKPLDPAKIDEIAAKLRSILPALLEAKRLVAVGTGTEGLPPGVSPNHAYAVLGFDPATDTVTIWNPHGNSFKPKGEPGRAHGYPTRAGMFTVPLADMIVVFRGFTYETDEPARPDKPRARPAAPAPAPQAVRAP